MAVSERFYGCEIWDASGKYYVSVSNVKNSMQHNRPTSSNVTYNSKYPFHVHDGMASYYSGSCSAKFAENTDCPIDDMTEDKAGKFVLDFVEWLHNDLVKYLRVSKDTVIPCGILDTVNIDIDNDESLDDLWSTTVSFNWEQLADRLNLTYTPI